MSKEGTGTGGRMAGAGKGGGLGGAMAGWGCSMQETVDPCSSPGSSLDSALDLTP